MVKSYILAAGALIAFPAPAAFADWYIVHGPDSHCRVLKRYVAGDEQDFIPLPA